MPVSLEKIISGGQTGVDRAALDVAIVMSLPCGGWCPRGRMAEDGRLPLHYSMTETETTDYAVRTQWNIRDSDGTLILAKRPLRGGTALTERIASQLGKPHFVIAPLEENALVQVANWISTARIRILNIAGPRESQQPGIYRTTVEFLGQLLRHA